MIMRIERRFSSLLGTSKEVFLLKICPLRTTPTTTHGIRPAFRRESAVHNAFHRHRAAPGVALLRVGSFLWHAVRGAKGDVSGRVIILRQDHQVKEAILEREGLLLTVVRMTTEQLIVWPLPVARREGFCDSLGKVSWDFPSFSLRIWLILGIMCEATTGKLPFSKKHSCSPRSHPKTKEVKGPWNLYRSVLLAVPCSAAQDIQDHA